MKRRDFLKRTSLASGALFVPSFLNGFNSVLPNSINTNKRLVIIQLSGGNDGLNTVVPYRNDFYYKNRQRIALREHELIKLNDEVGLHNSLSFLKTLYESGELTILNSVGYPNPNRSHFRSTDIWHTASSSQDYWQTGWVGRYLDTKNRKSYSAIEVDDTLSLLMKGKHVNGVATKNAALFYSNTQDTYFRNLLSHHNDAHLSEHNLGYLYKTMISANESAEYIYQTSKIYNSNTSYPSNVFGNQLKTIANFINSGLETEIYYATLGGFDTHANQINTQKRLLKVFDDSMTSFIKDLKANDTFKDTLVLVFSEFGRRLKQNGANGTDHGAANNVFVIGSNLKTPGLYNTLPNLSNLDANGDLKFEIEKGLAVYTINRTIK